MIVGEVMVKDVITIKKNDTLEKAIALEIPQLIVADTKVALGDLARINRNKMKAKFVAITGSNGKTTVKEMVAAILKLFDSPDFAHALALQARAKVEQFDWEIVKRKWIDILK